MAETTTVLSNWSDSTAPTSEADLTTENGVDTVELVNAIHTTIPYIPFGLGIIIVTAFGILGNLLSAIVLSRKRLRSSYTVLTLGLTFVDTVYLITKLLRYGLQSLFVNYGIADAYVKMVLPLAGPYLRSITFTAHTASTYFTIAIAVDRYMAICRPDIGRKYCTRKCARLMSLLVIIWAFVFNATRWLEFRTVESSGDTENQDEEDMYYIMETTKFRTHPVYREVFIFWVYGIMMFMLPFVTLLILNISIFFGLRYLVRGGATLTSTQRRDTSFSVMLIGVVLVFLICNVDYLVLDILNYCEVKYPPFWDLLGNFMLTVNSAVNFIIYCLFGWKFRQELWKLIRDLCPCLKQHGSHDIVVTEESQWVKDTMNNMDLQTIPRVSLSKASSKNHM